MPETEDGKLPGSQQSQGKKISKPEKIDGKRHQKVDIYYSTIGLWTAPEPETLEQEYMAYYQAMQKRKKRTA